MSSLPAWLEKRLKEAPNLPGCYLMVDASDTVVYVGKAKNLRKRLQQYFRPNSHDNRFFVGLLETLLTRIDTIVSNNEKEAFILEDALIKKHRPRFNVRLKDDKSFLHLHLNRKADWPRLEVVRRPALESSDLFGPYTSASAVRKVVDIIHRNFQLRSCTDQEFHTRHRPCLEHQIGRCPAPCVKTVDRADYAQDVENVRLFLSGRGRTLLTKLAGDMEQASNEMDFEKAAFLRDRMKAIERSLTPQSIAFTTRRPVDSIGLYREGARGSIDVLRVREGVLADAQSFVQRNQSLPSQELISNFIRAYYEHHPLPHTILSPVELPEADGLAEFLSEQKGRRTRIKCPQRGDMRRLVDLACTNSKETTRATFGEGTSGEEVLEGLKSQLKLDRLPTRIECYDISNIQGTEPVASMVVALDGEMVSREYRSFKIRSGDSPDDYRMMAEVLERRLKRGMSEGNLPDLILVDGGKGQLNVAIRVLQELQIDDVELASLAKERVEDEEGKIGRGTQRRPSSRVIKHRLDRVFRPGRKNPIHLASNSSELYLLQRLRDEAHRFAITHHKKRRAKRTLHSRLLDIEGVGAKRMTALLTHFGSLASVRSASVEELSNCPGVGLDTARRIREALAQI